MLCAALADDDAASLYGLASEELDAKSFAFRLAAVTRTADSFLVCHILIC
jgi:hypothetical protein